MLFPTNLLQQRYATQPLGTPEEAKNLFGQSKILNLSLLWLSLLFNAFLCGIFTYQVIKYWSARHNDRWWVKACVWWVTVLVYGSWVLIMFYAWWTIVAQYGDYTRYLSYIFLSIMVLLDVSTAAAIQAFFTYRTFRLNNRNWYLVGILSALIGMSIGSAISQGVIYIGFHKAKVRGTVLSPMVAWTCASMSAELIITISLLWGLLRTRTGWHHSDRVILRLIRITLEAQVPPLILTSVYTITLIIYFHHQLAAYINNSKLNAIGLMYSLNSRATFIHQDVSMVNPGGTDWRISQMKSERGETTADTTPASPSRASKLFGFARKSISGNSKASKATLVPSENVKSVGYGDPLSSMRSTAADPIGAAKES